MGQWNAGAMKHNQAEWRALVGKDVILNSFGIVRIRGVAGDRLLVGDPDAPTAIPLAVVHTVETLAEAPDAEPAAARAGVSG